MEGWNRDNRLCFILADGQEVLIEHTAALAAAFVIAPEPLARSAGGVTLHMQPPAPVAPRPAHPVMARGPLPADTVTTRAQWQGTSPRARRFDGLRFDVRVASSRRQVAGVVSMAAEPRVDRLWAER